MPILQHKDILQEGKVFAELQKEIDTLKKSLGELITISKNVHSSGTGSEAKERLKLTQQLTTATDKLAAAEHDQLVELQKVKIQLAEKNKRAKEAASLELKLVNAYDQESKKLNELRKQYKNLAIQNQANTKEAKGLLNQITQLDKKLKQVDATVGQHQRSVGNYSNALKGVGRQLLGAAGIIGGVDLLIKGFTSLRDRTIELDKATRQIRNTFDVTTKQAKQLSSTILALANNFDVDYNEILKSANAVSKEFGISAEKSLKLIEEGFKKGSNNSGEFLDILREYPVQLKSVGLNAEESFAIINQQVRDGVYSDKGIDAIKEAGISIRQNTKAFNDAIEPIEKGVKAEIRREQAAGNTFKAMQLIAGELKNVTQQQKQIILSDIFRGAGEDAASFVENLENVSLNLDNIKNQTSAVEEANLGLSKVWNSFVSNVFDSEGIFSKVWATILNLLSGAIAELERFLTLIGIVNSEGKALGKNLEIPENTRKSYSELTKETKNLTQAQKELIEQYKNDAKFLDDYVLKLEDERRAQIALMAAEAERRKAFESVEEISTFGALDDNLSRLKEQQQREQEARDQARIEELKRIEEFEQAKLDIRNAFEEEGKNFAKNAATQIAEDKKNKDLDAIEAKKDALKLQLEQGLINEIQYQRRLSELNKEARIAEARAKKREALYSIAIDGVVAFVSALARGGFIAAGRAAAITTVKAAAVAATPLPKFFDGEERVKLGKNPKGRDTIPAMLNEGERVVPTKINDMLGDVPNEMLPQLVSKGLMFDKNFGMSKGQKDTLLAGLLMQGIKQNDKIIDKLGNLGVAYTDNKGFVYIKDGNGKLNKIFLG